ncbi:TPA: hypothetical protein ACKTGI_003478 [Pseudomonas aeruginosa]
MIRKIILALTLLYSCSTFSANESSEVSASIQACNTYINEYVAVVNGSLKNTTKESAHKCIADSIKQAPMYIFAEIFVNRAGLDIAISYLVNQNLSDNLTNNIPEIPDQTYIEKLISYVFFYALFIVGLTFFMDMKIYTQNSHKENISLTATFSTTGKAFLIAVLLAPIGTTSLIGLALGMFFGMAIYVTYLCLFLVVPIFSSIFIPADIEQDYPRETIETVKSLVSDNVSNLLKIKTAEFNLKSLDVSYNVKTDLTGKILADSVQDTLNCYAINSEAKYENGKVRLPKSMQNAYCYAAFTNNAYFQNFGSIDVDDKESTEFWIDKENEIENLQEEERRYACVNRLNSLNKQSKNLDCIDYRNNEVVRDGIYAKMITESLSYEELEKRKSAIIENRFANVNAKVKTSTADTYEKMARKQINTVINGAIASLFFAFSKSSEYSLKTDEYIAYFKKNKITFNGYGESKSDSNLFLLGKSSTSAQSLLVPVEKPEFYVVSNSNDFKQNSYIDNLIPPSSFDCKRGISNCTGIKEVNIADLEKKTAQVLNYSSKSYFALSGVKKTFSLNNQYVSLALMFLSFIMKISLLVVSCTTYLMFVILAMKLLSLFIYMILVAFDFIVILIKYMSSLAFKTQSNAAHAIKELMFNAVIEPVIFIFAYVMSFWVSISAVSLAVLMLNLEFTNVMQKIVTLRIDSFINLCILLTCLVLIALAPGLVAKWASEKTLKKYQVRPLREIDSDMEGFYGEGKNYTSKFMRKLLG